MDETGGDGLTGRFVLASNCCSGWCVASGIGLRVKWCMGRVPELQV
jgi:hypothetical protein